MKFHTLVCRSILSDPIVFVEVAMDMTKSVNLCEACIVDADISFVDAVIAVAQLMLQ